MGCDHANTQRKNKRERSILMANVIPIAIGRQRENARWQMEDGEWNSDTLLKVIENKKNF